jgi:putative membrane protein
LHKSSPQRRISMNRTSLTVIGATIIASGVLLHAQAANQQPASSSQAAGKSSMAAADHMFVMDVAMDGMAEVEHGKLASEKASHDKVKAFGQRMVTDHGKAGDELKSLAASKQMTLPTSLDAKHQAMHDQLAKLSGTQFDTAYVRDMVAGHKKAVAAFTKEAMSGKDSDVKAWAAKTLPTIREHLMMIEGLQKEMSSARSTK